MTQDKEMQDLAMQVEQREAELFPAPELPELSPASMKQAIKFIKPITDNVTDPLPELTMETLPRFMELAVTIVNAAVEALVLDETFRLQFPRSQEEMDVFLATLSRLGKPEPKRALAQFLQGASQPDVNDDVEPPTTQPTGPSEDDIMGILSTRR